MNSRSAAIVKVADNVIAFQNFECPELSEMFASG